MCAERGAVVRPVRGHHAAGLRSTRGRFTGGRQLIADPLGGQAMTRRLRSEPRTTLSAGTPYSPHDHIVVVEGVVQMTRHLLDVQAPQASDATLWIGRASARKDGEDSKGFFKLGDEQSAWILSSIHQAFSRRTCLRAVAVNRTRRGFNASAAPAGSPPHRPSGSQRHPRQIPEGLCATRRLGVVEPVAGIQRQEFDFRALG